MKNFVTIKANYSEDSDGINNFRINLDDIIMYRPLVREGTPTLNKYIISFMDSFNRGQQNTISEYSLYFSSKEERDKVLEILDVYCATTIINIEKIVVEKEVYIVN